MPVHVPCSRHVKKPNLLELKSSLKNTLKRSSAKKGKIHLDLFV